MENANEGVDELTYGCITTSLDRVLFMTSLLRLTRVLSVHILHVLLSFPWIYPYSSSSRVDRFVHLAVTVGSCHDHAPGVSWLSLQGVFENSTNAGSIFVAPDRNVRNFPMRTPLIASLRVYVYSSVCLYLRTPPPVPRRLPHGAPTRRRQGGVRSAVGRRESSLSRPCRGINGGAFWPSVGFDGGVMGNEMRQCVKALREGRMLAAGRTLRVALRRSDGSQGSHS